MVLGELAIIAIAKAVEAGFNFGSKISDGQPQEYKDQVWKWIVEDQKKFRRVLGLEE
jgi:hypothetical protein